MSTGFYLVAFDDARLTGGDKLVAQLNSLPDWILPIKGIVILQTALTQAQIYHLFVSHFETGAAILITEVDPGSLVGFLPQWAVHWLMSKGQIGKSGLPATPSAPTPAEALEIVRQALNKQG